MPDSSENIAIAARKVWKHYNMYPTPVARLKEVLTFNRVCFHREFTALSDVNFEIKKGETVGVVGQNGAGKSTLLKMLAGIIHPSEGELEVKGKVSSIIELGTGFHPDFSGRDNARMNAAILGIAEQHLEDTYTDIVQFAELGKFIDMPVKTYSSGMFARLAFSIAINVQPDILLVDEALAVGDAIFAQRCIQRIRRLQEQGVTIFFVSHDTNTVRGLCTRVVLMDRGKVLADGDPKNVVQQYEVMVAERLAKSSDEEAIEFHDVGALETSEHLTERRFGTFEAKIETITVENDQNQPHEKFISGDTANFRLSLSFEKDVKHPVFGIMIRNRFGAEVFGTNTHLLKIETGEFAAKSTAEFIYSIPLKLGSGSYQCSFAIHTPDNHFYDYRVDSAIFEVLGAEQSIGMVPLETEIEIKR